MVGSVVPRHLSNEVEAVRRQRAQSKIEATGARPRARQIWWAADRAPGAIGVRCTGAASVTHRAARYVGKQRIADLLETLVVNEAARVGSIRGGVGQHVSPRNLHAHFDPDIGSRSIDG